MQFLIHIGCTTNLLSKKVFDKLPGRVRELLEESNSHGLLADGIQLNFYSMINLPFWVRYAKAGEASVLSHISKDAILGMPFLVAHYCTMEFKRPILRVEGKELTCSDRHGHLLLSKIQIMREVVVTLQIEMMIQCQVTAQNFRPVRLTEGWPAPVPPA